MSRAILMANLREDQFLDPNDYGEVTVGSVVYVVLHDDTQIVGVYGESNAGDGMIISDLWIRYDKIRAMHVVSDPDPRERMIEDIARKMYEGVHNQVSWNRASLAVKQGFRRNARVAVDFMSEPHPVDAEEEPESSTESYMTTADLCRARDWTVGSVLVGTEKYNDDSEHEDWVVITAIGDETVLARSLQHDGVKQVGREATWDFSLREWRKATPEESLKVVASR